MKNPVHEIGVRLPASGVRYIRQEIEEKETFNR